MRQKFFDTLFAAVGDITPVPDAAQSNGSVSFSSGWGPNYARNLQTDALALAIDRAQTNYLINAITAQLQQYQEFGVPEWINSTDNGGTPFAYDFGAKVRYSASGNPPFNTYVSVVGGQATNTSTPGADSNWALISTGRVDLFNDVYSAAIGGYPLGAVLMDNAYTTLYKSTTAANTTDFNSTPASIPSLWKPIAGDGFGALYGALAGSNIWTGPQMSTPLPVNYGATITLNLNNGNNFVLGTVAGGVITGGVTGNFILAISATTNYGQSGTIEVIQDGTGGRTISSFSSNCIPSAGSNPNLTGTANHRDKLFYYVGYDGKISLTARNNEG